MCLWCNINKKCGYKKNNCKKTYCNYDNCLCNSLLNNCYSTTNNCCVSNNSSCNTNNCCTSNNSFCNTNKCLNSNKSYFCKKPVRRKKHTKYCGSIKGQNYFIVNDIYHDNYYKKYNHYYITDCNHITDHICECNVITIIQNLLMIKNVHAKI